MSLLDLFGKRRRPRAYTMTEEQAEADLRTWRIVTIRNDRLGQKVVIRIKTTQPAHPDVGLLTTAVVIKWPYGQEDAMPTPEVNEQQLAFERLLDPLACENDTSEIVQVTTGSGVKEWVFYTWSRKAFMEKMNALLAHSQPAYPIQIEFYEDPRWAVWQEAIDGLGDHLDPAANDAAPAA